MPKLKRELAVCVPQLKGMHVVLSYGENEGTALVISNADMSTQRLKPLSYLGNLCADVAHDI